MPQTQGYHGQCHCGAVRFSVHTDLSGLGDCNCSRCRRLGWVMQSAPADQFQLIAGADNLTLYRFNSEKIEHLFCKTCGIEAFARGTASDGKAMVMVNVNCFEPMPPFDRESIHHWDGANF